MENLKKYSEIKYQIKQLTLEAKELEFDATQEMEQLEKDGLKPNFDFGTPYFTKRTSWEFGKSVEDAEKDVQKEVEDIEEKC